MKKKKLPKAISQELRDLLTAKAELEKSLVYDVQVKHQVEERMIKTIATLEHTQSELSRISNDLESKYGKASEFNIETGEIMPSGVFE